MFGVRGWGGWQGGGGVDGIEAGDAPSEVFYAGGVEFSFWIWRFVRWNILP